MLGRAFAPLSQDAGSAGSGVVDLAAALGVAARIGARVPGGTLAREVGRVAAARFLHASTVVRERETLLCAVFPRLSAAASARGLPLTFLKFAALQQAGYLTPGSRPAADVDVLVPDDRLADARGMLAQAGFQAVAGDVDPHQIEPHADDEGRVVEVHRWIPWLAVAGWPRASHAALADARALVPLADAALSVTRPKDAVLTAHVLSHGLAQNGFFPAVSPFFRAIADLVDLTRGAVLDERAIAPWLVRAVSTEEAAGCLALARDLKAGDVGALDAPETAAGLLLRHGVCGALDESYRRDLRAAYFKDLSRRFWHAPEARHAVRSILFPGADAFARLYGFPRGTLRGGLTFVTRPLALAWRHLRHS